MLPRHLRPGVRRIRREGDPAAGTVTAVEQGRGGSVTLTLHVELPQGAETTVTRTLSADELPAGLPRVGQRLPVRYDRHRPERVELDVEQLRLSRG